MVLHEAVEQHRRHPVELRRRPDAPGQDRARRSARRAAGAPAGRSSAASSVGVAVADAGGDGQPVLPGALAHGVELQRAPGVGGDLVGDEADHRRAGPGRRRRRAAAACSRARAPPRAPAAGSRSTAARRAALLSTSETVVCDTPAARGHVDHRRARAGGPRPRRAVAPSSCRRFHPAAAVSARLSASADIIIINTLKCQHYLCVAFRAASDISIGADRPRGGRGSPRRTASGGIENPTGG